MRMEHEGVVGALLDRFKSVVELVLGTSGDNGLAAASLLLMEKFREVARQTLQAWADLRAREIEGSAVKPCCDGSSMRLVHTRPVTVRTLFGEVTLRVRTFQCSGCGRYWRPDDRVLGVPETGSMTDDLRSLLTPLLAELPHRVASDLLEQFTGVGLSSRGAQSVVDSVAEDLAQWRRGREADEKEAVEALRAQGGPGELCVEIAMDGVKAHVDGVWKEPKVASVQVRRVVDGPEVPELGEVVARRYTCVLGSADQLGASVRRLIREAGWQRLPVAEVLGDGAEWIWNLADRLFPGTPQTLDWWHLAEHFHGFAKVQFGEASAQGKSWVEAHMLRLAGDRVGDVLGALKRTKPRNRAAARELSALVRYVTNNARRVRYRASLEGGVAIGSGAAEGTCKHLVQARFKRSGMRWKTPGFLAVLELRVARLNDTLDDFWASRGLPARAAA
jgi:hypothetical protein